MRFKAFTGVFFSSRKSKNFPNPTVLRPNPSPFYFPLLASYKVASVGLPCKICVFDTDIQGRSQTWYTTLCNGIVSHGAQIVVVVVAVVVVVVVVVFCFCFCFALFCFVSHRANTIITREEDRQQEMHHIQNCLSKCGYEPWVFAVSNNKETDKQKAKYANRPPPPAKGSVVIPYVQGVSETIARVYQSKGIRTHYKPVNSIRQQLVAPKDKIKTVDKSGVVYNSTAKNVLRPVLVNRSALSEPG